MIERWWRWSTALLLVPALTGCSIGDVRRDPPARATAATAGPSVSASARPGPPPSPVAVAEIRATRVAVPGGYDRPHVDFTDADHGYALFASCGERPPGRDCPALLYATTDGGRRWRKLRHPRPVADDQQMYPAPGLLTLWSAPYGWWTSTDGGRTFRHTRGEPAPPEWRATLGRFQIDERSGRVGRWDGGELRRLPVQPDVPGLNTVTERGGLLVAAGAHDGRAYAAISTDQGRTWRTTPVPAPDGPVGVLWARAAPESDLWLVGERPDRTGFPALWRWGDGWQPVRPEGHPAQVASVLPIGSGMLAVTGPEGVGAVVGDRYAHLPWPLTGHHHLRMLDDGTVFAAAPDGLLLGTGRYADRRWVKVTLEPV